MWLNINIKPPIYIYIVFIFPAVLIAAPALVHFCQLACIHILSDSVWGVALQYGGPCVLPGVIGDVVRGSQVNLVHLACASSAGIGLGSIGP